MGRCGVASTLAWVESEGDKLWKVIWHGELPPKLKHLLWRLCANCVAYGVSLYNRHISDSPSCKFCGHQWEDLIHAIFECPLVSDVWRKSDFAADLLNFPNSSFKDLLHWAFEKLDSGRFQLFCSIIWACWTLQNKWLHEEVVADVDGLVSGFCNMVRDSLNFMKNTNRTTRKEALVHSISTWRRPQSGWFKVNWDAAIRPNKVGIGVVVRNEEGAVIALSSLTIRATLPPSLAEAFAARLGAKLCVRIGLAKVIMEGDALNIVRKIQLGSMGYSHEEMIIDDIHDFLSSFTHVRMSHVKRQGNIVAHNVAKLCL